MKSEKKKGESKVLNQLKFLDQLDDLDSQFSSEYAVSHVPSVANVNLSSEKQIESPIQTKNNSHHDVCVTLDYLKDSQNPLEHLSRDEFVFKYGFSKERVHEIFRMIEYGFRHGTRRGNPKSPMYSLLLTLQFLTTGSMEHQATNFSESASQSTVSRILKKVTGLLSELKPRFVKIPEAGRTKAISGKFCDIGGFPDVFACIGSTHIAIKTPAKSVADDYMNENGYYSYRLFACTGPDLQFFEIISRWPGASHENKIFHLSEMFQRFEFTTKMDGFLLANERYSCTTCVMTPIESPMDLDNEKYMRYNMAHRKTYNFPDAIKLLKCRFRCLQNVLAFQDGKKYHA